MQSKFDPQTEITNTFLMEITPQRNKMFKAIVWMAQEYPEFAKTLHEHDIATEHLDFLAEMAMRSESKRIVKKVVKKAKKKR